MFVAEIMYKGKWVIMIFKIGFDFQLALVVN